VLCPPPLRPGDVVRIVAPSSPFDRTCFFRGLAWLSGRYRLRWSRRLLERERYLAGSDEARRAELQAALDDVEARAVIAVRGGYGASRVAHLLNYASLRRHPKWLVGFSDVTALHLEVGRLGMQSCHAHNLTGLGRGDASARLAWLDALERPEQPRHFGSLTVLRAGEAQGTLAGGNLSLVATAATSGRLALPTGCVLFLEEVGEAPYRLDRMLSSLIVGRHLDDVIGIAVGDLTRCGPGTDSRAALEAVQRALEPLRVPVLAGLPVGHEARNEPLILGARARLSATARSLTVGTEVGATPG
jgi:muramoyltetrapeptide carboxypeptidase